MFQLNHYLLKYYLECPHDVGQKDFFHTFFSTMKYALSATKTVLSVPKATQFGHTYQNSHIHPLVHKISLQPTVLVFGTSMCSKRKKISDNLLKISMRAQLPKGACLNPSLLFRIRSPNINTIAIARLYLQRGFTAGPTPVLKMIVEFSFLMY